MTSSAPNTANIDHTLIPLLPKPLGHSQNAAKTLTAAEFAATGASKMSSNEIALRNKSAMNLAMAPGKSLGMNVFMMYMSGTQLTIWTMNMLVGLLSNPLKSLFSINKTFKRFEDPDGKVDLLMPKVSVGRCNGEAMNL